MDLTGAPAALGYLCTSIPSDHAACPLGGSPSPPLPIKALLIKCSGDPKPYHSVGPASHVGESNPEGSCPTPNALPW